MGGVDCKAEFERRVRRGDVDVLAVQDRCVTFEFEQGAFARCRHAAGDARAEAEVVGNADLREGGGDGGVVEQRRVQPFEAGGEDMARERQRPGIGGAAPEQFEHGFARRQTEHLADDRAFGEIGRIDHAQGELVAERFAVVPAHPFGKPGPQVDLIVEHWFGDEGASAVLDPDQAVAGEVFQRAADGVAVDREAAGKCCFRGQAAAGYDGAGRDVLAQLRCDSGPDRDAGGACHQAAIRRTGTPLGEAGEASSDIICLRHPTLYFGVIRRGYPRARPRGPPAAYRAGGPG